MAERMHWSPASRNSGQFLRQQRRRVITPRGCQATVAGKGTGSQGVVQLGHAKGKRMKASQLQSEPVSGFQHSQTVWSVVEVSWCQSRQRARAAGWYNSALPGSRTPPPSAPCLVPFLQPGTFADDWQQALLTGRPQAGLETTDGADCSGLWPFGVT